MNAQAIQHQVQNGKVKQYRKNPIELLKWLDKNLPNEIWLIYFTDITDEKFTIDSNLNEFEIIDKKKFNRLELYLLKKN